MDGKFISNIDFRDKHTLLYAAKQTKIDITINNSAYNGNNVPLKDTCAVYLKNPKQDASTMWVKYHELKNDVHARKILDLDYLRYRHESAKAR